MPASEKRPGIGNWLLAVLAACCRPPGPSQLSPKQAGHFTPFQGTLCHVPWAFSLQHPNMAKVIPSFVAAQTCSIPILKPVKLQSAIHQRGRHRRSRPCEQPTGELPKSGYTIKNNLKRKAEFMKACPPTPADAAAHVVTRPLLNVGVISRPCGWVVTPSCPRLCKSMVYYRCFKA